MEQSPDWSLNQAEFVNELKQRWDGIEVKEKVSDRYILRWSIKVEGYPILGGVQSDYHTLTIDGGPIDTIAEFAIWYRNLVPEQYPLFLYKGSTFDRPIELSLTISKDELMAALTNY
jgi:hypothetical protein